MRHVAPHRATSHEIGETRAAARRRPQQALAFLDLKNAFGKVRWVNALRAVLRGVPMLGPLLWTSLTSRLWLQDADGKSWHALYIYGSLLQGGWDGHAVFRLLIGVLMVSVCKHGRVSAIWIQITVWLYVGDVVCKAFWKT